MAVRHKNTNNGTKINGGNTVKRTVTKPIIKDEPIENPYDFSFLGLDPPNFFLEVASLGILFKGLTSYYFLFNFYLISSKSLKYLLAINLTFYD